MQSPQFTRRQPRSHHPRNADASRGPSRYERIRHLVPASRLSVHAGDHKVSRLPYRLGTEQTARGWSNLGIRTPVTAWSLLQIGAGGTRTLVTRNNAVSAITDLHLEDSRLRCVAETTKPALCRENSSAFEKERPADAACLKRRCTPLGTCASDRSIRGNAVLVHAGRRRRISSNQGKPRLLRS